MARFRIVIDSELPPEEAWNRLLNLHAHDDVIPLTRIEQGAATAPELSDGHHFVAYTGAGPAGFHDPMTWTRIEPPSAGRPGLARVVKQGRVVGGEVTLTVGPGPRGSRIEWDQRWLLPWAPEVASLLTAPGAKLGYRYVLGRLLGREGS
jgi:hypothetical protein